MAKAIKTKYNSNIQQHAYNVSLILKNSIETAIKELEELEEAGEMIKEMTRNLKVLLSSGSNISVAKVKELVQELSVCATILRIGEEENSQNSRTKAQNRLLEIRSLLCLLELGSNYPFLLRR